jgi:hypothetical protein
MSRSTIMILLFIGICPMLFAQSEKQSVTMNLEGQFIATANAEALFLNIGGPALKFSFPKFSISIDMYPSLKFEFPVSKFVVLPMLGVGPQVNFLKGRRFVIAFPFYYYSTTKNWRATAGIGYVFTKPRKQ